MPAEPSPPVLPPAEGRHSLNTYKACMKFSDCYSGFVSTTMGPKDYMVSNTHCCQSDGCNRGSVPRKSQPGPSPGVPPSLPQEPTVRALARHWSGAETLGKHFACSEPQFPHL